MAATVDGHDAAGFQDPGKFSEDPLVRRPVLLWLICHMMQDLVDQNCVDALVV